MDKNPNLIQSLTRGLICYEYAIEHGEVVPADLSSILNIDRSSVYRLLCTLVDLGYLVQNPTSKKFVPNADKIATLYHEIFKADDWIHIVSKCLKNLTNETNETSTLGILDKDNVVYIGQEQSDYTIRAYTPIGTRRQVFCSALGKAILAFMDEFNIEKLINTIQFQKNTNRTITDPQILRLHLKSVKEYGYALDDEETFNDVRCIAAPIFDGNGKVIASIGITGPITRIKTEIIPQLAKIVIKAANNATSDIKAYNISVL